MLTPRPTQCSGAIFLADRKRALLADEPRVGKTGAAIMAADLALANKVLVITTSSGRPVWKRAFRDWSRFNRQVEIMDGRKPLAFTTNTVIAGWGSIASNDTRAQLLRQEWDCVILDESHFAKNFTAKRTQAAYGQLVSGGELLNNQHALANAKHVWALSGTPIPNSPFDLYPMLRALKPECLRAFGSFPDVTKEQDFMHRYCIVRMKKISNFNKIPVVVGGRNLDELKLRIGDFMLRRTQQDVGITAPIYETLPVTVSEKSRKAAEKDVNMAEVLAAAEAGDTKTLDMHLGPLRRITGGLKANAIVDVVAEEFECGLDKIVLAYWHKDVGDILHHGLAKYGVVGIDGATPPHMRGKAEQQFLNDPNTRVMLGQIQAAGEAVDFSSAAELIFVETTFLPSQMKQMSLRVTNLEQKRQPRVRVAVLEGSIDEALENILLRKWSAITPVLKENDQ